jgi:hypothetical protein
VSLTCFGCSNEYAYIGSDAHPGRCPGCGARTVSTAGRLTIGTPKPITPESADAEHVRQIFATDATDRSFRFVFVLDDGDGQPGRAYLSCVTIEGVAISVEGAVDHGIAPMNRLSDAFEAHRVTLDASSPYVDDNGNLTPDVETDPESEWGV